MQALYKKPIDGVYDYETEGVQYLYATCTEDAIDTFVADGWVTDFSKLKEIANETEAKEIVQEASEEVLDKPKRGRPAKVTVEETADVVVEETAN